MKRLTLALLLLAACGSARPSAPLSAPYTQSAVPTYRTQIGAPLVTLSNVPTPTMPAEPAGAGLGVRSDGGASPTAMTIEPATARNPALTPEPTPKPPKPEGGLAGSLRGSATWYAWHPGEAAAGPGLRAFLGPDWRGKTVTVFAPGCTCAPVAVKLTDWCLCRDDRVIDLDVRTFAALADPDRGIIPVLVMEGDWTR